MPRPRVSVIIPNRNRTAVLREALAGVRAQTFEDLEVIVVDDASDPEHAAAYDALKEVTVLRHACQRGASAARNTGLAAAQGVFVAFLDSDDVWLPDKLERQVASLDRHPEAVLAYCHATIVDANLTPLPSQPQHVPVADRPFARMLHSCLIWTASCVMARRDVVMKAGGFDTRLSHSNDWDMWLSIARFGAFVPDAWPGVLYRRHPDQLSRRIQVYFEADRRVREKWMRWAREEQPEWLPEMRRCASRQDQRHAWNALLCCGDRREAVRLLLRAIRTCPLDLRAYGRLARAFVIPARRKRAF